MSKQKERNELEVLRAENRNLKKQINHLKKEVGRHQKRAHQYEDLESIAQEIELEKAPVAKKHVKQNDICPKCASEIERTDLDIKWLLRCSKCNFRKTEKK